MKIYILILTVFLSACNSTPKSNIPVESAKNQEVPTSKKVYFFQHKILPEWTFTTNGGFYADLIKGDLSRLNMAASEVVSNDYAKGITSEILKDGTSVLITFPTPQGLANCYFVLIQKSKDGFSFDTYEKAMSFGEDDPVIGVVGSWSPEGSHGNLGGRTYIKASDFVSDILGKNG
ncbi:hypothetical protein RI844_04935 [Thalassotalea fonticola]|uniref:Uncharacterized protein n=1 Tax=Thalassotalea fonticola TaxID=3065649 RepID=A0ABZ0GRJ8_9GAMM|nr:hypothetical protein RI844_04935 [Colwelliaceae bacterium S1-1]